MLSKIEIKNFKAIKAAPLILNDLAQVNYLVGKNGSGKSSVLEGLYIFQDTEDIKKLFTREDTKITLSKKGKTDKIYPDNVTQTIENVIDFDFLSFSNDPNSRFHYSRVSEPKYRKRGIGSLESFFEINSHEDLDSLNETLTLLNITDVTIKLGTDPFSTEKIFVQNDLQIDVKSLSSGVRLLHTLRLSLSAIMTNLLKNIHNGVQMSRFPLFVIEEPEIFLHPDFQKKIPHIISSVLEKDHLNKLNAQFFISTHSPFIISAAGEFKDTQKVYMIEGGEVVDKNGTKKSENQVGQEFDEKAKKGYSGNEVVSVVAKMLGADGTDLGYPENYILVEESSKKEFLEALFKRKEFSKNIEVISSTPGGDNGIVKSHEHIKNLLKTNPLFRSNPIFSDKYIVFTDYVAEYYNEGNAEYIKHSQNNNKDHAKAMNIKKSLGKRFIAEQTEFERYYPVDILNSILEKRGYTNWDRENTFAKYLENNSVDNINTAKCEIAKLVGEEISMEDFKTHFPKLHNCIFGDQE